MKTFLVLLLLLSVAPVARAQYPLYHLISDTAGASNEAQARHLPIAYVGLMPAELANSRSMTSEAISSLQGGAVVICFAAHTIATINPMIRDQYGIRDDDGNLGDGNTWIPPKIVFTDPAITKVVGRVAATQIRNNPQIIFQTLGTIRDDPTNLTPAAMPLALSTPMVNGYPLYHDISDTATAQAEATARHLPLAYLGSHDGELTRQSPAIDSEAYLSQMALSALQGKAVVIYFEGSNMSPVPMFVHMQYHVPDDGTLDQGAAWLVPKVVFADPGLTKTLGRVSATQMKAGHEASITSALASIRAAALVPAATTTTAAPVAATPTEMTLDSLMATARQYIQDWMPYIIEHELYFGLGLGAFVLLALFRVAGRIFGD